MAQPYAPIVFQKFALMFISVPADSFKRLMETARKAYYLSDARTGRLMGADSFGNKYFEDRAGKGYVGYGLAPD